MYNLVIADDEREILTGLANFFPWQELGFKVTGTFDNGLSALEYIRQNGADVLLSDIKMEKMTGLELVSELRRMSFKGKIVLLSGYRDFDWAQKAIEFGVSYYAVKPCYYPQLTEIFSRLHNELDASSQASTSQCEQGPVQELDRLDKLKKYIDEKCKDTSLCDAAAYAGMNPYYFSRYFKQQTGMNFVDYLVEVKMKKAAQLFEQRPLKVYEVSELVGYSTPKSFERVFKRFHRVTPSEFRRKLYGANPNDANEDILP